MKMLKMIWFDHGQTLIAERKSDGIRGTEAVLQYTAKNKYNLSAEQVQAEASAINQELGRFDPQRRQLQYGVYQCLWQTNLLRRIR